MGKRKSNKRKGKKRPDQKAPPPSDDDDNRITTTIAASKFMEDIVGDDVLLEILIRLPDPASVGRCRAVCKRWLNLLSRSAFMCTFVGFHRWSHRQPCSFLLSSPYAASFQGFRRDSGLALRILSYHDEASAVATCDDLALMAPRQNVMWKQYWVCNVATDEWHGVPEVPAIAGGPYYAAVGLVCRYGGTACSDAEGLCGVVSHFRYRIAIVGLVGHGFESLVYCSEAREWAPAEFVPPRELPREHWVSPGGMVAGDGLMCALVVDFEGAAKGLLAFDPFVDAVGDPRRCFFMGPPAGRRGVPMGEARLGAVRDRVRMAQLYRRNKGGFSLKVWELNCGCGGGGGDVARWDSVYDVVVGKKGSKDVTVLCFDPKNGNILYFLRDRVLCRHNIRENRYEECCEIIYPNNDDVYAQYVDKCLRIFPHLCWPTPTKSLASSTQQPETTST